MPFICESCKGEATRFRYNKNTGQMECVSCVVGMEDWLAGRPAYLHERIGNKHAPSMTEAYRREVRSRRVAPDGSVFNDRFGRYSGKQLFHGTETDEVRETKRWLAENERDPRVQREARDFINSLREKR